MSRSIVVAFVLGSIASVVACGGRTVPLDAEEDDGGAAGGSGAAGASGGGSGSDAASEAPPLGWGEVCLGFFAVFNASRSEQSCQSCIFHAEQGACAGEIGATQLATGPCGHANACAASCTCASEGCTEKTCACIASCMKTGPDNCLGAWTAAYACIRDACDGSGC